MIMCTIYQGKIYWFLFLFGVEIGQHDFLAKTRFYYLHTSHSSWIRHNHWNFTIAYSYDKSYGATVLTIHAVFSHVWGPCHNWMDYEDSILQLLYYDGECLIKNRSKNALLLLCVFLIDGESILQIPPNISDSTWYNISKLLWYTRILSSSSK